MGGQVKLWFSKKVIYVKSLLVLQNFSTARQSGNISQILKAFFVRDSSEYETSDSDRILDNLSVAIRRFIL